MLSALKAKLQEKAELREAFKAIALDGSFKERSF